MGYVRRNYFVPLLEADSFEALNQQLLAECLAYGEHRLQGREKTVNEFFQAEQVCLLPLPAGPFTVTQIGSGKVDPYATVRVDKNRYSVPSRYVGLKVQVHLDINRVDLFHGGMKLASHPRVFGNNKWQLDPDHYLELIQQRPGSFQEARPIRQWRQNWPPALERLLADNPSYMLQGYFAKLTNTPYKRYVEIGEGTHTIIMEKNRMQLFQAVQQFLDERLKLNQ